eukprot:128241_1
METLIQFRKRADSLSKIEYQTFLLSLDRKTLLSILFKHFHENSTANYNIDELNTNLLRIVQKRDKTHAHVVLPTLDKIPMTLINEISSYLDLQSYCKFEKVSRNTMIAARSPTRLQFISSYNLEAFYRYQSGFRSIISYDRFKNIKELTFSSQPDLPDKWLHNLVLNNLNKLEIHEDCITDFFMLPHVCLKHLTKINLRVDILLEKPIEHNLINKLLQKPDNLQCLEVTNIHLVTLGKKTELIFPKLTALSLNEFTDVQSANIGETTINYGHLINLCGAKLLSFHTTSELSQLNINPKQLCNLTELCLTCVSDPKSVEIISQFDKLKRVTLNLWHEMWWDNDRTALEFSIDLVNKLFSLKYLESIDFIIDDKKFTKLTRLIQNALMIYPKKKMKMYISGIAPCKDSNPVNNIHFDLQLLVNSLNAMTQDFMLTISLTRSLQSQLDNIQLWLNSLCDTKFYWLYDNKYNTLHVASKYSKINGYSRKWIANCFHCKYR